MCLHSLIITREGLGEFETGKVVIGEISGFFDVILQEKMAFKNCKISGDEKLMALHHFTSASQKKDFLKCIGLQLGRKVNCAMSF